MNNNPIVSVIIPTFNRKNLISRAVRSVLNQTYKNFELIIIDDGSIDNTQEVIIRFQKNEPRIKYFYQENKGWPSALNKGLSIATGQYIAFLDSDDEWFDNKLEKQIEVFNKFPNVGLVSCWAYKICDEKNKKIYKTYNRILNKKKWCLFWKKGGIISLSTVIVKMKAINTIGKFDENLKSCADLDFYMRLIKNYDFYFVPEPLINYYETQESLSRKEFWVKWVDELEYILRKHELALNKCKKSKSNIYKTLGTCYLIKGNNSKGRLYLLKSIFNNPLNIRLYAQFFISFLPFLYKKILFFKRKNF
ncbi:MAG: glycosyltransferase [Candidatus Aenigmatarchaeota archaeon]